MRSEPRAQVLLTLRTAHPQSTHASDEELKAQRGRGLAKELNSTLGPGLPGEETGRSWRPVKVSNSSLFARVV